MSRLIALPLALCGLVLGGCSQNADPKPGASQAVPEAAPEIMSLFNRSCRSCHVSGAGGAPRVANRADWEPRLSQGLDILLDHTISGYKGMPPMGMCMDCSEDDFVELIEYMAGQPLE